MTHPALFTQRGVPCILLELKPRAKLQLSNFSLVINCYFPSEFLTLDHSDVTRRLTGNDLLCFLYTEQKSTLIVKGVPCPFPSPVQTSGQYV